MNIDTTTQKGLSMRPIRLMGSEIVSPTSSNWLLGYSSLLGPIAGIMIVDYFLVRKQSFDLPALYKDNAAYPAWNVPGLVAFAIPVALTIVAITTGYLSWFYDYGWFTGSILGGIIYYFAGRGQ